MRSFLLSVSVLFPLVLCTFPGAAVSGCAGTTTGVAIVEVYGVG